MTIYIPIAVEKELPEISRWYPTLIEGSTDIIMTGFFNGEFIKYSNGLKITHWLKPVLVSDLITAVQNSIGPQRRDLHTAIEISINEFFK